MMQQIEQDRRPSFLSALKKNWLSSLILALLYGFWFIFGVCNESPKLPDFRLDRMDGRSLAALLLIIGLIFIVLMFLNYFIDSTHRRDDVRVLSGKQYRILFAFLLTVLFGYYSFLFVYNGPGSVATDTYSSLQQYMGQLPLRNDNPFLLTVLYGWLHSIGLKIIDWRNGGIYMNLLFQTAVLAWAYVRTAFFVYEKTGSLKLLLLTWAFFLIVPVFGGQAQIWLKDSLHAGFFTLFFIEYIRMFSRGLKPVTVVRFCVLSLLACMTRKATFWIVILCMLVLGVYHFAGIRKKLEKPRPVYWAAVAGVLTVFLLYDNVLLPACGVEPGSTKENYAVPFRQTALFVRDHEEDLSEEELAVIDRVMDRRKLVELYSTENIDEVKGLARGATDQQLADLLRLDISLLFRYPLTGLQAIAECSWRYFDPMVSDKSWIRIYVTEEDSFGWFVENPTAKGRLYQWFCVFWEKTPVLTVLTDPGLYIWLLFFALMRAACNRRRKVLGILLPLAAFALGLTVTPVNGDLRYAFPIISALPLVLAAFGEKHFPLSSLPAEAKSFI